MSAGGNFIMNFVMNDQHINDKSQNNMYLVSIPRYEKANIFGANWLLTEWYPSRQLVCSTEEANDPL